MNLTGRRADRLGRVYLPRRSVFLIFTAALGINFTERGWIVMKNRWLIALAAVGIHVSIGSVYAWSVLTKPIMKELGLGLKETQWTFSLAILFLGLSAAFLGSYVERYGPKKSGLFATLFFCAGMFGAGFAVAVKSLPLLYLFYGVIGGIGLGTGYITPVSTLVKWFPGNRGVRHRGCDHGVRLGQLDRRAAYPGANRQVRPCGGI